MFIYCPHSCKPVSALHQHIHSCKPVAGLMQYRFPVYSFIYCRCPAAGGRHKSKPQHACTNHACYFFIERLCDLFLHSWDGMYMLCLILHDTQFMSGCAQSCHKKLHIWAYSLSDHLTARVARLCNHYRTGFFRFSPVPPTSSN